MTEQVISKYHRRSYIGKGVKGADENGYSYYWDSTHKDLAPTSTFDTPYGDYCVYCQQKAKLIQGQLKANANYGVTGTTCTCEAAEAEKEYKQQQQELMKRHYAEVKALEQGFRERLKIDKIENLKIKQRDELKHLEWSSGDESYFTKINGKRVYD